MGAILDAVRLERSNGLLNRSRVVLMAPTSVDSARRQEDASGSEEARHGQRHIGALRRLGGLFNRFDHYLCALSHRGVCCGGHRHPRSWRFTTSFRAEARSFCPIGSPAAHRAGRLGSMTWLASYHSWIIFVGTFCSRPRRSELSGGRSGTSQTLTWTLSENRS